MLKTAIIGFFLFLYTLSAAAGSSGLNLQQCIDHALENNLKIKRLKLDKSSSDLSYMEAKAAQYPSLEGRIGYSLSPDLDAEKIFDKPVKQSAEYSMSTGWTAFKGNSIRNDIKIKQLETEKSTTNIKSQEIAIIHDVTNAYLQVFYSTEALKSSIVARDVTKAQRDRIAELLAVGSATKVDLARMDASLATDEYNVVTARNNLLQTERSLKSILEFPLDSTIDLYFPDLSNTVVLPPIPDIEHIYAAALEKMPGIANSELNKLIAALSVKKATAGFYPTLGLSAGLSTGNNFGTTSFMDQVTEGAHLSLRASLSIPIYNNRKIITSVEKAKISAQQAELALQEEKKSLLVEVENAYYDAMAARSRLEAANLQYEKSLQSFEIAQEQFKLGMINSTELLVEKNTYLTTLREQLQSKINALMSFQIINIYMGLPVQL